MLVLALGLGSVALAQRSSGSFTANVTLLDGKLRVTPKTFSPGKLTLVVVNQGKLTHALAIMGTGLKAKQTPTLKSGRSAQLSVTLQSGMYHVWDPVRSSMSHATMLMVKKASSSGSTSGGSTSGGSMPGMPGMPGGSGGGGTTGGGDPNDPCAGM